MGCYPYLTCVDWSALAADLAALGDDLVSFAAVPDPFRIHFKDHFVADLTQPARKIMSPRRRRYAEKARQTVDIEFRAQPIEFLDQWMRLFAPTVQRLNIRGIRAYSRKSIARQLSPELNT
jgi:hypothetical protein